MGKSKVSFVFDDGFVESCLRIADIYEARGLCATFAVLVNYDGFMPDFPKGDFDFWNALQKRGHHIHPHGWDHCDLSELPFDEAREKVDRCLEYFQQRLEGFDPLQAVYHFTYNRSTPEIEAYVLDRCYGLRTADAHAGCEGGMNGVESFERAVFTCSWHGPDCCDEHLATSLEGAKTQRPELFLYMMHGLDDEGWGPVSAACLERALDMIINSDSLEYCNLTPKELIS